MSFLKRKPRVVVEQSFRRSNPDHAALKAHKRECTDPRCNCGDAAPDSILAHSIAHKAKRH